MCCLQRSIPCLLGERVSCLLVYLITPRFSLLIEVLIVYINCTSEIFNIVSLILKNLENGVSRYVCYYTSFDFERILTKRICMKNPKIFKRLSFIRVCYDKHIICSNSTNILTFIQSLCAINYYNSSVI